MNKSSEKQEKNSPLQMVNDLVEVMRICDAEPQEFIERCLSIKTKNQQTVLLHLNTAQALIYNRIKGEPGRGVWDVVFAGRCVCQLAGPRGARDWIDESLGGPPAWRYAPKADILWAMGEKVLTTEDIAEMVGEDPWKLFNRGRAKSRAQGLPMWPKYRKARVRLTRDRRLALHEALMGLCTPQDPLERDREGLGPLLEEALERLKPMERRVLELRFGLGDIGQHTMQACAKAIGRSRERVRQLERDGLRRLRSRAPKNGLEDFR